MTDVLNGMVQEGYVVTADVAATFSPYLTEHIKRFGAGPSRQIWCSRGRVGAMESESMAIFTGLPLVADFDAMALVQLQTSQSVL